MRQLWLHIGTPKTGSTSLQRFTRLRNDYLHSKGIDSLIRRKRASYNDLSIYLRSGQMEPANAVGAAIRQMIAASKADKFILSSEMFTGVNPAQLRQVIGLEEEFDVKIVCYFRRQDRFLESNYKQKLKTAKVGLGFSNYVTKFGIGAGGYLQMVDNWQAAWPEAEFIFKRFEPHRFPKRDVVYDFMSMLGLDIDADGMPPSKELDNPTPSIDVLDVMQLVAQVPGVDPRLVVRKLPLATLPLFSGRAMTQEQAREIVDHFAEQNEVLRQRFFPEEDALFLTDDLDGPAPDIAQSSFTDEQRQIIGAVLKTVVQYADKNSG